MRPFRTEPPCAAHAPTLARRWLLGVAACGAVALCALVAGAWTGLWTGEAPVWERARVGATPRGGGVPLWTLDWPSVPPDSIFWPSMYPVASWLAVLAVLVGSVVFTLVVERKAQRRYEPLGLVGATVTVAGVVFASRAAHFMTASIVDGTEVPGALDDAVWMLLAGAALSALACARIAFVWPRRDGATLAITSLITALAASCICERLLVRPDHARPAPVAAGFERTSVPNVPPARVFFLPYEVADEVLEVSNEGEVTYVGRVPGEGPRVPWSTSELGSRLAQLAAAMPGAPIAPGSVEMAPDATLFLRIDGRAPASVLVTLQDAAAAAGIWQLGLIYTLEGIAPEAVVGLYLPRREPNLPRLEPTDSVVPAEVTLQGGSSGGIVVTSLGQPVVWDGVRAALVGSYSLRVGPELPIAALIELFGRLGEPILGPITLVAPR